MEGELLISSISYQPCVKLGGGYNHLLCHLLIQHGVDAVTHTPMDSDTTILNLPHGMLYDIILPSCSFSTTSTQSVFM